MNRLIQLLTSVWDALFTNSDPERRALEAYLSQSTSVFDLEARQRRWDEQRAQRAGSWPGLHSR